MLALTSPLDAYRADCASLPPDTTLTSNDAGLLSLASVLYRMTQVRSMDATEHSRLREQACRAANAVATTFGLLATSATGSTPFLDALRASATEAEERGALSLANLLLHLGARAEAGALHDIELGRIMAQRARIARKAGAYDQARTLYEETLTLGTAAGIDELVARARIGFALLARSRGNFPEAHENLTLAALPAERSGNREVRSIVHHELMVIAATRERFDEAAVYAWSLFLDVIGNLVEEADALTNLGQALFDSGQERAALRAFSAALTRRPPRRIAIPALGGAARAASRAGLERLVWQFANEVDALSGTDLRPETVWALGEVAMALVPFAPEAAESRRAAAYEEASRAGFHELTHRLDRMAIETPRANAVVVPAGDFAQVVEETKQLAVASEYAGV